MGQGRIEDIRSYNGNSYTEERQEGKVTKGIRSHRGKVTQGQGHVYDDKVTMQARLHRGQSYTSERQDHTEDIVTRVTQGQTEYKVTLVTSRIKLNTG